MTEEEFRTRLDALGISYQCAINRMNSVDSPGIKNRHKHHAQGVLDEIAELEREYRAQHGRAAPTEWANSAILRPQYGQPSRTDELATWRQRVADKLIEGAHHDVLVYCANEIGKLGVPCAVQEFRCPHCNRAGNIFTQGARGTEARTWALYNHEYVGDGKFYCDQGKKRRIFQEPSLFQSGPASQEPEPRTDAPEDPWIDYHDQLIKEWFDGEKALIDDLYPERPKRVEDPVFGPLIRSIVPAIKILTLSAVIIAVIVAMTWVAASAF